MPSKEDYPVKLQTAMRELFSTEKGRVVLRAMMQKNGVFTSNYDPRGGTEYFEGRRAAVLEILQYIMPEQDPQRFLDEAAKANHEMLMELERHDPLKDV